MFSIFYFSPLWVITAVFFLNDFFGWYNMLNVFSLHEYCLLLALSMSIPTASIVIYYWVRNLWEKQERGKRRAQQKKTFDFLQSNCADKELWTSVSHHIQKITDHPIQCSAYVVSPTTGTYAICITYSIGTWKIGIELIDLFSSETVDLIDLVSSKKIEEDVIKAIEEVYYKLYKESGLRDGLCSYLKLKELIKK